MVGFPPAIGGMLAGSRLPKDAYKIWVPAGSLSFLILVYLIYCFYWASIRPHPERKTQFWQRFALPMTLALVGSVFLWAGAPRLASQVVLDQEEPEEDTSVLPVTPVNPNAPSSPLADPEDADDPSAQPVPKPAQPTLKPVQPMPKPTQPGPKKVQVQKKQVVPAVPAPTDSPPPTVEK
jgi:hypothetical protein